MNKLRAVVAFFLIFSAGSLQASTVSVVAFGDSLVDGGNLDLALKLQGGTGLPAIYPDGQFTNGDTWATQLGLAPSLTGGTNFAYGGARAISNKDGIPDLKDQIKAFRKSGFVADAFTTGVIWIGGNDFLALGPDASEKSFLRTARKVTRQISRAALQLNRSGINDVVVLGLPEFGSLPGAIDVYNQRLGQKISFLDQVLPNSDFSFFDVNGLYQAVATQVPPSLIDTPCLLDPAGCAANPENYILYDEVHPSEWVHTILADALADEIGGTAPLVASYDVQTSEVPAVPLPASAPLLLAGIFGLGLWSRRRRSPA